MVLISGCKSFVEIKYCTASPEMHVVDTLLYVINLEACLVKLREMLA